LVETVDPVFNFEAAMSQVIELANRNRNRATRHPFDAHDLYRRVTCMVRVPPGTEVAYLHDRARLFMPDGTVTDVAGGQVLFDWAPTISRL
jgi:hypothetical protein